MLRCEGRQLGDMARGVIRQLRFEALAFDVVLIGSLFSGSPLMAEGVGEQVHGLAPAARLVRFDAPPVIGAVLLGMEQAGQAYGEVARKALIDSGRRLIGADQHDQQADED
jgi:hypothetical protein